MPDHDMRRLLTNVAGVTDERRLRDVMRGKLGEEWAEIDRQAAGGLRPDIAEGSRRAVARQVLAELADDPRAWRDAMVRDHNGISTIDRLIERVRPYADEGEPHAVEQRDEDALKVVLGGKLNSDWQVGHISNDTYTAGLTELGFIAPAATDNIVADEPAPHPDDYNIDMEAYASQRNRELGHSDDS